MNDQVRDAIAEVQTRHSEGPDSISSAADGTNDNSESQQSTKTDTDPAGGDDDDDGGGKDKVRTSV